MCLIPSYKPGLVSTIDACASQPIWERFASDSRNIRPDPGARTATAIAQIVCELTRSSESTRSSSTQKTTAVAINLMSHEVFISQQGAMWTNAETRAMIKGAIKSQNKYVGDIYFCQANGAMPNMHAEMIIVNCLQGNVAALVFGSYELAPCPCCAVTLDEMRASVSGVGQTPNLGWIHPTKLWGIQKR